MFTAPPDAPAFETPNATMHTLASPATGSSVLAVWRVEMAPGAAGPVHTADREQVWVILDGALEATEDGGDHTAAAGQTFVMAAGTERQVRSPEGVIALVSSVAPASVSTPDGETRPLPWAA